MFKIILRTLNAGIILALLILNVLTVTNSAVHSAIYQLVDKLPMPHLRENSPTARTNALNRKIRTIEMRNAKLKANTKLLTNKIAKRTAKSAARNISSSAIEAVPYVGIAAVITSLGFDIKDACDTMKDIDALEVSLEIVDESTASETETNKVCGYEYSIPTTMELSTQVQQSLQKAQEKSDKFGTDISDSIHSAYKQSLDYGVEMVESWSTYFESN